MDEFIEALLLGILQGITEFLPISSSGHLKAAEILFGSRWEERLTLDVVVHLGTLLVIIYHFRGEIGELLRGVATRRESRILLGWLLLGSVPAAILGILARDFFTRLPATWPALIGVGWVVTGIALLLLRNRDGALGLDRLRFGAVLAVGLAQALAIFPGVSRSGATIAAGVGSGIERSAAARFSFLLAIPAIAGAALLEILEGEIAGEELPLLAAAFVAAVLSGWASLRILLWLLKSGKLWLFAFYTFAAAAAFLALY